MTHPDTFVKQTEKGLGLFAKRKFKLGEILWIHDEIDIKIALADYLNMDKQLRKKLDVYSYMDNRKQVVIPWDDGKYVNHSCSPNSTGLLEFDNISVALKDIEAGEEIVENYNSYYGHFESFDCICMSKNCSGKVSSTQHYDDSLRLSLEEIAADIKSHQQYLFGLKNAENADLLRLLDLNSVIY